MCHDDSPFYLATKKIVGPETFVWYAKAAMGKNKLGKIATTMATKAGLKGKLVNHSIRRKTVQDLHSARMAPSMICQVTGHKNVNSINNYAVADSNAQKRMSNILMDDKTRLDCLRENESYLSVCEAKKTSSVPAKKAKLATSTVSKAGGEDTSSGSVLSLENFERVAGGILPGANISRNVSIQMNYKMYTSTKTSSSNVTLSPKVPDQMGDIN